MTIVMLILAREPSYKRVRTAVRIIGHHERWKGGGVITLAFTNDQSAKQFRQTNAALVLDVQTKQLATAHVAHIRHVCQQQDFIAGKDARCAAAAP